MTWRYARWLAFAIFIFIPATAVNVLLWKCIHCEWHSPYQRLRP